MGHVPVIEFSVCLYRDYSFKEAQNEALWVQVSDVERDFLYFNVSIT